MAAIDFPNSPAVNDVFTAGNSTYKYTGVAWISNNLGSIAWTDVTGKPTEFTPSAHTHATTDVTGLETYVDGRVQLIVDAAPAALDTLNELAAAIGDDANFAGTVTTALAGKAATVHTHVTSDVTGLDTALAGKQAIVSGVSDTEIGYLDGVTSAIQTQLDGKAAVSHTQNASTIITTSTDKSANYTLVAADENTYIRSTGSAITITVPDVLQNGESVNFIQAGAGQITFAGSGVTLNSADSLTKTAKQFAGATIVKSGGAYYLIGNLA